MLATITYLRLPLLEFSDSCQNVKVFRFLDSGPHAVVNFWVSEVCAPIVIRKPSQALFLLTEPDIRQGLSCSVCFFVSPVTF